MKGAYIKDEFRLFTLSYALKERTEVKWIWTRGKHTERAHRDESLL